jgi:hypothetical protein
MGRYNVQKELLPWNACRGVQYPGAYPCPALYLYLYAFPSTLWVPEAVVRDGDDCDLAPGLLHDGPDAGAVVERIQEGEGEGRVLPLYQLP